MRFVFFGIFVCGFAVFGPPLRPPQGGAYKIFLSISFKAKERQSLVIDTFTTRANIPKLEVLQSNFKLHIGHKKCISYMSSILKYHSDFNSSQSNYYKVKLFRCFML